MTYKEELFTYRLKEADETLIDAKNMLKSNMSPRSIINRVYYVMFYSVLALFLKWDIKINTSKHSGIISIFDEDLVHSGKIDKKFSKILHQTFEIRQTGDYKEMAEISIKEAEKFVNYAEEFFSEMKARINEI